MNDMVEVSSSLSSQLPFPSTIPDSNGQLSSAATVASSGCTEVNDMVEVSSYLSSQLPFPSTVPDSNGQLFSCSNGLTYALRAGYSVTQSLDLGGGGFF